jgi:hypothetical protein
MRGHQALALWQELDLIMTHNGANAGPMTKFGDGRRLAGQGHIARRSYKGTFPCMNTLLNQTCKGPALS